MPEEVRSSSFGDNQVRSSISGKTATGVNRSLVNRPLTMTGMAIISLSMSSLFGLIRYFDQTTFIQAISVGLIVLGVALVIIDELFVGNRQNSKHVNNEKRIRSELDSKYNDLYEKIQEIENRKNVSTVDLSDSDYNDILEKIRSSVDSKLTDDVLEKITSSTTIETEFDYVAQASHKFRERVEREIYTLSGRANVNLFIGSVTTILGISILAYMLVVGGFTYDANNSLTGNVLSDYMLYYIPRLSVVVFIEVFSYFFLRLYRANLNDMKYFQNELTNIESKLTALNLVVQTNDQVLRKSVVDSLLSTERNFILKKGETTIDLEVSRMDAQKSAETTKILQNVLKETKSLIKLPK
ncbi:hypothetical protein [Photobacterium alginatilyticum]|uniref:DUF3087 domain-containing protein n=1 Tax=Photobacterium alginatilyticum TaxID=1775171 RepID=A0ABW9YR78_9GAMM|nr:hypothetical protein [Photobacterium alginatilyticum]NBI56249.1 hypothetical protein [Photobacterium alginatilyticum]